MSVQEKIHRLLWNKRYVCVPDEANCLSISYILIKDMTVEDRNLYSFIKTRELNDARKQGVPTEAELLQEAKRVGLWTEEDDLVLSKTDEHISLLQAELARHKFLARKKSIQRDIDSALERQRVVKQKKNEYFFNSADYYASEVAATFLVRRLVFTIDEIPLWIDDTSFLHFKRENPQFVAFVINEVLSEGILPIEDIREVARHPEWRLTWSLQRENLVGVFGKQIGDLNINQKLLVYWSRVYDSALESTEPPSSEVVNDDEKFDEWLANRDLNEKDHRQSNASGSKHHQERMEVLDGEYSEHCNCGAKAKNIKKGLGERVMHATSCPWGTYRKYSQQEKEQIASQTYSRNTEKIRSLLDQEQQVVVEKGLVEEHHLRGKKTRHILGMKTEVVSTKK